MPKRKKKQRQVRGDILTYVTVLPEHHARWCQIVSEAARPGGVLDGIDYGVLPNPIGARLPGGLLCLYLSIPDGCSLEMLVPARGWHLNHRCN